MSKRKIGLEQIFDNYLLFILFEPVNLMNIRYIFTTLLLTASSLRPKALKDPVG